MPLVKRRSLVKNGFTLIEALFAVAILAFGCSGILLMIIKSTEGGQASDMRVAAIFLAESRIEEIRAMRADSYPSGLLSGEVVTEKRLNRLGEVVTDPDVDDNDLFTRSISLRQKCPTSKSNELEVVVTWPGGRNPLVYTAVMRVRP